MSTILIIDDEASIRKLLRKLLEKNGYAVIEAKDGNQGLNLFKEHTPDLIITDLIMPEKEGLETIREMRALNPDVKIIAMSGGGVVHPDMYLDLAKRLGAMSSLRKPVGNDELLSTIEQLLAE